MVQAGDLVVVGLSGGGDSVCLLYVLKELREIFQISLAALHVHHGIRGEEADRDASFCRELCEKWNIPCQVAYVDVPAAAADRKQSLEEAARQERYRELEAYRGKLQAQRIAVAHHREDNAETVLWNLFRGSGLRGLAGMEPVNGAVVRPLLGISKSDIVGFLEENDLPWRQDGTNDSDAYTRNRIRHHVLDYVGKEINSRAAEHICNAAAAAAQADGYLRRQALCWIAEYGKEGPEGLRLDGDRLGNEEEILQTYVIREAVRQCNGLTDVTARHVAAVRGLLKSPPGAAAGRYVTLGGGLTARRSYGRLIFENPDLTAARTEGKASEDEEIAVDLSELAERTENSMIRLPVGENIFELRVFPYEKTEKIPSNRYTKWLDYDKIERTLVFRTRRKGDYLLLAGGKRKTVKSHMIDEKIPAGERDHRILIAQGSHVLWLAGGRLSDGVKLTENTKSVLQITMYGGERNGEDSCIDPGRRSGQEDQ